MQGSRIGGPEKARCIGSAPSLCEHFRGTLGAMPTLILEDGTEPPPPSGPNGRPREAHPQGRFREIGRGVLSLGRHGLRVWPTRGFLPRITLVALFTDQLIIAHSSLENVENAGPVCRRVSAVRSQQITWVHGLRRVMPTQRACRRAGFRPRRQQRVLRFRR
jgi:hypothetical protein